MKKISVIVPIYNVENYLDKCINSILNQTYTNIQLILVNDGSTDSSGTIAKKYAEENREKILYLEKTNGGLSDARNYAIPYVCGDYIAFVDSDDYIEIDLFKKLLPYMEKDYDMVKFGITRVDENGRLISENYSPVFKEKNGEEAFEILYKEDKMTEVACAYIYKTKFWKKNDFKYAKGLYHEDFGLTPLIMLKAKLVASTDIKGYNYVQTPNSIVRDNKKKSLKRAYDLLEHYDNMIKEIEKYEISEKSKENVKSYYTNCILLAINNIENEKDKNCYIKEIKKRKMIKNIKPKNLKMLIKLIILKINIKWYLKLREELSI